MNAAFEAWVARPWRMLGELLRPEWAFRRRKVVATVVVFGSARLPPGSHWYEQAREFSMRLAACEDPRCREWVVMTGGGPGVMEAANRGAQEAGALTAGLNIRLPHEQQPNPYISPGLGFEFRYFALRKFHFMLRARALVAFPGGFGTFDELFEALTLVQTRKVERLPIILVGRQFWQRALDFDWLAEQGVISAADAALVTVVDTGAEAAAAVLATRPPAQGKAGP